MLFIGIKKSKRIAASGVYAQRAINKRFVFEYINNENQLKKIHFGQYDGLTFIDHGDKKKRTAYLKRHFKNEDWGKINPGSLSALLLWGKNKELEINLVKYLKHFKFKI